VASPFFGRLLLFGFSSTFPGGLCPPATRAVPPSRCTGCTHSGRALQPGAVRPHRASLSPTAAWVFAFGFSAVGATRSFLVPAGWQLYPSMYSPGGSARSFRVTVLSCPPRRRPRFCLPTDKRWPLMALRVALRGTTPKRVCWPMAASDSDVDNPPEIGVVAT
jgi:hypothetical protein